MLDFAIAVASIVLVDLVLSGDNALVIGAAASGLPRRERWWALLLGGGAALLLRVLFTLIVSLLLQLPLLQALGGLLLLIIAIRLLMDRDKTQEGTHSEQVQTRPKSSASAKEVHQSRGLVSALVTILVADVTMSLDNVLAVGALALGNLPLLAVGIMLSIIIVLLGSALVAVLIRQLPWLLDVAALVLGWTAARMLLDDIRLGPVFDTLAWTHWAIPTMTLGVVVVADVLLRLRAEQRNR
jgi:YjbE family integral membrane protein